MRNQYGVNNFSYVHGMSNTATYNTWHLMKQRCQNKAAPDYYRYGKRGVGVCRRWRISFLHFLEDMGERPRGMTLDRIDNSGHYSKENCRWATQTEQRRNTRQNKYITYKGETRCMVEWAEYLNIPYRALKQRIRCGWGVERAFTQKLMVTRRTKYDIFKPYNNGKYP